MIERRIMETSSLPLDASTLKPGVTAVTALRLECGHSMIAVTHSDGKTPVVGDTAPCLFCQMMLSAMN